MHQVNIPQSTGLVGVARRDITPPVGIYHRMWGAATHDRSTGVHRPLVATALAIRPSGDQAGTGAAPQVIVGIDHCLLWDEPMDALEAAVLAATGLSPGQLHIAFSHTHAAGLMDPARGDLPGGELIAPYLDRLADDIAAAVREAVENLRPAQVVYGLGRSSLARNRDFVDPMSGEYVCGFNPAGSEDDTVLVARVTDAEGRTIATVVNYACHPTTLAWDNTLISPDYVGAMREVVEQATGAPCLFLQGASGDLGPRHGFVGDVSVADRNGRELGYAALAALESLPPAGQRFEYTGAVVSGATIGTWGLRPMPGDELASRQALRCRMLNIDLPYRAGLPTRHSTETQLADWQKAEAVAAHRNQRALARDCRAQVERLTRQLARLRSLPPGSFVPLRAAVWQWGDAYWVLLAGEHYQYLQRTLRAHLADHPVIVSTVTGGWRPGYLPVSAAYGKGIYQETIAVVAQGSIEQLVEVLHDRIVNWRAD